jgi:hypothetical protein
MYIVRKNIEAALAWKFFIIHPEFILRAMLMIKGKEVTTEGA